MVHFLLALSSLFVFMGSQKKPIFQKIGVILVFLFAALRYMYGNDYSSYLSAFNRIKLGFASPFEGELLYTVLNVLCPTFDVLIVFASVVFVGGIYIFLSRNSSMWAFALGWLIFLINPYLFLINLSAIRQCFAMMLFIVAVEFLINRQLIPYFIIVFIAAMFHNSAWLLLICCLVVFGEQKQKLWSLVLSCVVVFFLFFNGILDLVNRGLLLFDDKQYLIYTENSTGNSLRATLLTLTFFIYVCANLPKLDGKYRIYGRLYLIGLAMALLAYRMSAFARMQMYFDIFSVVVLPEIYGKVREEGSLYVDYNNPHRTLWKFVNRYVLPFLIIVIYCLRYYSFFTTPRWDSFCTYQTIFQK